MATLAIRGHETRGKEVIKILEMLGGEHNCYILGNEDKLCYFIEFGTNRIVSDYWDTCKNKSEYYVLSLEDFLNKYPYKIGDEVMVVNKHLNANGFIKSLHWYPRENIIRYQVDLSIYIQFCEVNELKPYKGRNMTALAIRGHETRGKEVIEILEMLGGKNSYHFKGDEDKWFVLDGSIKRSDILFDEKGFTLEEFLEKYPYKVGDKVIFTKYGDNDVVTVESMSWTGTTIEYNYNGGVPCLAKDLQPYKEKIVEENLEQIKLTIPNGYEFFRVDDDNKVVLTKKQIQYPKNYKECCKVMNYCYNPVAIKIMHKEELMRAFQFLLLYRDAYLKIAGEENKGNIDYVICNAGGKIIKTNIPNSAYNHILNFPTEEMRDAFYENFKEEIEECKELL